jgi:hypothetical protein
MNRCAVRYGRVTSRTCNAILCMIYVAAFAASEYASTIGRVAKPFNPLLGETFEYVRPDKNYRFFMRGKPDWTETTPEKLCTQTSFVLYKPSVRSLVANILIC